MTQIIALMFLASVSLSRSVVVAKQRRPTNIKNIPKNIILIKFIFRRVRGNDPLIVHATLSVS